MRETYTEPVGAPLVIGRLANTPANANAKLYAYVPSMGTQRFGPLFWKPETATLPGAGNRCLLGRDENGNLWLLKTL